MKNLNAILLLFFLAHWPSLNFFYENIEKNPKFLPIFFIGTISFFVLLFFYYLFTFVIKLKKEVVCGILFIVTFWFFSFSLFTFFIDVKFGLNFPVTLFWLLTLFISLFIFGLIKNKVFFSKIIFYISLALFITPILQMFVFKSVFLQKLNVDKEYAFIQKLALSEHEKKKYNNVFFIVVDGYSRKDVIYDQYSFNNIEFESFLTKKGFITPSKSVSNYRATVSSIPSIFMMNYIHETNFETLYNMPFLENGKLQDKIIKGYNPVVKKFKGLGYNYYHAGGLKPCDEKISFKCIKYRNFRFSLDMWRMLQTTPIPFILSYMPYKKFEKILTNYQQDFTLDDFASKIEEITDPPYFVYFHSMELHELDYDANCDLREEVLLHQTRRFLKEKLNANPSKYFIPSLKCVTNSLERLIEKIFLLNKDPIIIIASDHHSVFFQDDIYFDVGKDFAVHLSIKFPNRCISSIPDKISNVNLFRLVFACIEGKETDLLEDKLYYSNQNLKNTGNENFINNRLKYWTEFNYY